MIVALVGQKGGSGKTTIAVSLAAEGVRRGLKVLLVDADPQGTAVTWAQVAKDGGHPLPEKIERVNGAALLTRELPSKSKGFDLTIVDTPPRHGEIQRAALMVADLAVIPSSGSPSDVWALAETAELVNEARRIRPKLAAFVVLTRMRATAIGEGARPAVKTAGLPVLRTELGLRVVYELAMAEGKGPTTYAASSLAAEELTQLFNEVLKKAAT